MKQTIFLGYILWQLFFVKVYGTYYVISQHKHFVHYTSIFRRKCSVPSVAVSCRSLMSCCGIFRYTIIIMIFTAILFPVLSRSKSWVCGLHWLGLQIRISPGIWMSLFCECCVLSGKGSCVGLGTLLESFIQCGVYETIACRLTIFDLLPPLKILGCL